MIKSVEISLRYTDLQFCLDFFVFMSTRTFKVTPIVSLMHAKSLVVVW